MIFSYFIDGLKVDKHRKLTVEAVLMYYMWFNRTFRNRASAWWLRGFSRYKKIYNQKPCVHNNRAQDYHNMLRQALNKFTFVGEVGKIKMTLNLHKNVHNIISIPVI